MKMYTKSREKMEDFIWQVLLLQMIIIIISNLFNKYQSLFFNLSAYDGDINIARWMFKITKGTLELIDRHCSINIQKLSEAR